MTVPHYYDPQWCKRARIARATAGPAHVDIAPAAAHVRALLRAGALTSWIAAAADLSTTTVHRLATTPQPGGTVRARTARLVLAVTVDAAIEHAPDATLVCSIGARRRIESLLLDGWRHRDLYVRGVESSKVTAAASITVGKRRQVVEVFAALDGKPGGSRTTARRAAAAGARPAWAWTDIDDPRSRTIKTRRGDAQEALRLWRCGETIEMAAARTGAEPESMATALIRSGTASEQLRFAAAREEEQITRRSLSGRAS